MKKRKPRKGDYVIYNNGDSISYHRILLVQSNGIAYMTIIENIQDIDTQLKGKYLSAIKHTSIITEFGKDEFNDFLTITTKNKIIDALTRKDV